MHANYSRQQQQSPQGATEAATAAAAATACGGTTSGPKLFAHGELLVCTHGQHVKDEASGIPNTTDRFGGRRYKSREANCQEEPVRFGRRV